MTDSLPSLEIIDSANCMKYVILSVSDKTSAINAENNVGIALQKLIQQHQGTVVFYSVIPFEDVSTIEKKLRSVIEQNLADIILTIGCPGIAFKDTTPETYCTVLDLRKPGLNNGWVLASLEETTYDKLPRAVCGISNRIFLNGLPGNPSSAVCGLSKCNKALIISLPGDEEGAVRCYEALAPAASFASVFMKEDIPTKVKPFETKEQNQTLICESSFKSKVSETAEKENDPQIGMVDVDEALLILKRAVLLNVEKQVETCLVEEVFGRVPVERYVSSVDEPATDVCTHDGYALKFYSSDYTSRTISGHVKLGDNGRNLTAISQSPQSYCYRVVAGAPVPLNADRVLLDSHITKLSIASSIKYTDKKNAGFGIMKTGSIRKKGDLIFKEKYPLKCTAVGTLNQLGLTHISVYKKPVIAILSGRKKDDADEGVNSLKEQDVRGDPNYGTLNAILKKQGFKVLNAGFCADEPSSLLEKLSYALSQADVVILQADTAMKEFKFARPVLQTDFGAFIQFSSINMIPRNCSTFASLKWEGVSKLVFALPGDSYAAFLSTILLVLPTLRLMEGVENFTYSNENLCVQIKDDSKSGCHLDTSPRFLCAPVSYNESFIQVKLNDLNLSHLSENKLSTISSNSLLVQIPASPNPGTYTKTASAIPLNHYI